VSLAGFRALAGSIPAILEPAAIKAILTYLKIPDKPPDLLSARIPEQTQFA
jgi:hypothetical protein